MRSDNQTYSSATFVSETDPTLRVNVTRPYKAEPCVELMLDDSTLRVLKVERLVDQYRVVLSGWESTETEKADAQRKLERLAAL